MGSRFKKFSLRDVNKSSETNVSVNFEVNWLKGEPGGENGKALISD